MAGYTFSFASGLNDSVFGKSLAPIKNIIEKRGEAWEQKSLIKDIFNVYNSKSWGEKFTYMTGMNGFMPTGENASSPHDEMQEGYDKIIVPYVWRDRFSITHVAISDSKNIDLKKRPAGFTAGYHRTREMFAAALLGAAVKKSITASFRGTDFSVSTADGKALFDTSHPSKLGKKGQTNLFADEFNIKTLGAAETAMQNFKGDNGEILDISPDTIIIPNDYELKNQVFEAIGSDKDPSTSNNGFNYHYGRWNIIVHPYLNQFITAGVKPWILFDSKANEEYDGAVWIEREPLNIKVFEDNDTRACVWDGFARFGASFNDWRPFAIGGITGGTTLISG